MSSADVPVLLRGVEAMPHGEDRIAAADRLIALADAGGDREMSFRARLEATESFVHGHRPMRAFATFHWCLDDFERSPAHYHPAAEFRLLAQFPLMFDAALAFPQVSLEHVKGLLDHMERRYRSYGDQMRPVFQLRHRLAHHLGDLAAADTWFERWVAAPRGTLSGCAGCDPSLMAEYLAARGRWSEAIEAGRPVLSGEITCPMQPESIRGALTVPMWRTGRAEEALAGHRAWYAARQDDLGCMAWFGRHIEFLTRAGQTREAMIVAINHILWLPLTLSPADTFAYAAPAALALRRFSAAHGAVTATLGDRQASTADLAEEMADLARQVAGRFDERNGNAAVGNRVERILHREPYDGAH